MKGCPWLKGCLFDRPRGPSITSRGADARPEQRLPTFLAARLIRSRSNRQSDSRTASSYWSSVTAWDGRLARFQWLFPPRFPAAPCKRGFGRPHPADVWRVALRDGGDEFLAQIFRHTLNVRNPRRAQPGRKTVRPGVSRIFGSQFQMLDFETELSAAIFRNRRARKKNTASASCGKIPTSVAAAFPAAAPETRRARCLCRRRKQPAGRRVSKLRPRRAGLPDGRPPNAARRWKKPDQIVL